MYLLNGFETPRRYAASGPGWLIVIERTIDSGFYQKMYEENEKQSVLVWCVGHADSSLSDSEDENPEALRPLTHYSLCDQPQSDLLMLPATPPSSPRLLPASQAVVISQPAPFSSSHQTSDEPNAPNHSSESVRCRFSKKICNGVY